MYRLWYFITNKDLGDVRELLTYSEYTLGDGVKKLSNLRLFIFMRYTGLKGG